MRSVGNGGGIFSMEPRFLRVRNGSTIVSPRIAARHHERHVPDDFDFPETTISDHGDLMLTVDIWQECSGSAS